MAKQWTLVFILCICSKNGPFAGADRQYYEYRAFSVRWLYNLYN
jgi:hypothetical protein